MKRKSINSFEFMNTKFDVDKSVIHNHIFYLISIALITYIGFILFNILILGSIDYFDLRNYMLRAIQIVNGQLPYISTPYEYPILSLIPMIISVIISMIISNFKLAISIFQLLMIICNVITILSVYLIVLKLYDEKIAFKAGILYTFSIVALYTTLTRFDALPVCLMMVSILLFVYNRYRDACITSFIGFFTKIFPIITYPFFVLYEIKQKKKVNHYLVIFGGLLFVLVLPFQIIMGWFEGLKPYSFATGASISSIYANTFTYAVHSLLYGGMKLPVSIDIISVIISIVSLCIFLYVIYIAYKAKTLTYNNIICYICIVLGLLIISSKFHSPQYFMWITPLLVILSITDIKKIICFVVFQILTFIEFPLMFGRFYTNITYTTQIGSYGWWITMLMFLLEYGSLIILLYLCLSDNKIE